MIPRNPVKLDETLMVLFISKQGVLVSPSQNFTAFWAASKQSSDAV